ncbi:MAG: T9SS type A sorting domain-containing protein [Bacteroidetes bacterium]|nr:T9SS type A sorting domain-containing protein [Bacteroidota bacterium]
MTEFQTMKSIVSGLFFLAIGLNGFTQSFQFIESGTGTAAQASYTRQAADTVGDEFILHCVNQSATTKSAKVRMTVLSTPAGCSNDVFFCDPIACYPATVHLSVAAFGIGAGDTATGALVPHIAQGFCCGDYAVSYCLFDVNNESDSVNVMVYYNVNGNHCTNGIGESENEYFLGSAFPNPTVGKCTIPFNLKESHEQSSIVFFDMMGEKINAYKLENNSEKIDIDISFLQPGIYFYSLKRNEILSSFEKLIIAK